jgi:4-carboxymuconolactone decarboxylase
VTGAPRVPPLTKAEFGDDETRALRAFVGDAGVERFLGEGDTPPLPSVLGTLIRHPRLAAKWLPYNDVLLRTGTLEPRLRELAICRVGWRTAAEYEWLQHVRLAHGLGITEAEIDAIADRGTVEWTSLEADVLRATDELVDDYAVSDATWARLAEHFDQQQLMELVFVVGTYTCLAMAFKSFGVQLDADLVDYPAPRVRESGVHDL